MKILVTGGAGYVGSHAVRHLRKAGHQVWIYDNLSQGNPPAVLDTPLFQGNLSDTTRLVNLLRELRIDAVMHFAAFALVGESVTNPSMYYENNVVGSLRLLQAMQEADVRKIVFSSTTATYGEPEKSPIAETTPQKPINPYGVSKLMVEQILDDFARAYGFGFAALRYFNAAGASADGLIGEDHRPESHLIPIVLQVALGQREKVTIFGNDYPTPDGTCIRDYIHVDDLAEAHLRALDRLQPGQGLKMNLGSGVGFSVQQVIEMCRQVSGHPIPAVIGARRPGDPPALVADSSLAQRTLDWKCHHSDLKTIVASAWNWHRTHPQGFATKG
ncbi:UDP-glucose 4-epimerase GalE [Anatilimnocola sp. NA78]|uniref:UDP-glucose 4-epimerase GalE n=1 Tax=Anatilimnocola sp. NA78 TaxID=3415683 RepID=UPI003CE56934